MKNKKIIIIICSIVGLLLLILLLVWLIRKDLVFEKKLIKRITSNGYTLDIGNLYNNEDKEYPFSKCNEDIGDNCTGIRSTFDVGDYVLTRDKVRKLEDTTFNLHVNYDYKDDEVSYSYRVTYQNGVAIFNGKLISKTEYSCNLEYIYGIEENPEVYDNCSVLRSDLKDFRRDARLLITDIKMLNRMKEGAVK